MAAIRTMSVYMTNVSRLLTVTVPRIPLSNLISIYCSRHEFDKHYPLSRANDSRMKDSELCAP